MLRIGVDIHAIGARQTGNETYIRNLVENMIETEQQQNNFYLYHTKSDASGTVPQKWCPSIRLVRPHNSLLRIPFGFPYVLKRDKIDVAHFQYVIPPVCPCAAVVMIHDISYEFHPEYFSRPSRMRMQLLIPAAARRSAHVLTVSEYSKRQIVEKYNVPEDKVTVTYNGVSENFRVISDSAQLEKETLRFGLERPFILAVGNLQPRKNIERLVRVYSRLRKQELIQQDLVLVGQLQFKGHAIMDEIRTNGVENYVKATGYVSESELVALYNRASLFVYPSYYEGFGLPVIEAMACGAPVITSNVSSLPEVAGDSALLIDPASDDELASAILKLANSPEERKKAAERGIAHSARFSWNKAAKQTLAILKEVAGG